MNTNTSSDQEIKSRPALCERDTQSDDDRLTRARLPKIYTKNGDLGHTNLFGMCTRNVPKWDKKIRAYGAIDELNSHIGKVREVIIETRKSADDSSSQMVDNLLTSADVIQQTLFVASSRLSIDDYKYNYPRINELSQDVIELLEDDIDQMTVELPPLKNFIQLRGIGTVDIHIARTVCRRAESEVAEVIYLFDAMEIYQYSLIMIYLNRLSDWLFTVARYNGKILGQNESIITPPAAIQKTS